MSRKELIMKIFKDEISTNFLLDNQIVLDIETTGVHRYSCHIQVVGLLSKNQNKFIQLVADDQNDEKNLLLALKKELCNKDIISYNGKNFDIPFIKARMKFHGIEFPKIKSHFDIYNYLIENRFFFTTSSFALQAMEEKLNLLRKEKFEDAYDQDFYKPLTDLKLAHICLHNKYDVINTEKLLSFTRVLKDNRSFDFNFKNNTISAYIKSIIINNNICKIRLKVSQSNDLNLIKDLESLRWNLNQITIAFPIIEGFVAKNQLANVYIQQYPPFVSDDSQFTLAKNILVISHNKRIELKNLVNLSKKLIDNFFLKSI